MDDGAGLLPRYSDRHALVLGCCRPAGGRPASFSFGVHSIDFGLLGGDVPPGPRWQVALFLAGALAILLAIVLARSLRRSLKLLLLLTYASYLLVSFKEGFVRQDDDVYIAFVALAPASLFLMLLQTPQRKRFSPVLCSIALLVTMTVIGFFWRAFSSTLCEGLYKRQAFRPERFEA